MKTGKDPESIASPNKTRITPIIIGFLTCLYTPRATKNFGGSYGAGVPPPPYSENRETATQHRLAPIPIKSPPGKDRMRSKLSGYFSKNPPSREDQRRKPGIVPIIFMGKMKNALIKGGVNFMNLAQ